MIELHDHLSEFSYGYGVTREAERLLASVGLVVTPFQPNLVKEAVAGFDVAFGAPGVILMLQFKLGQELKMFRRAWPGQPIPPLDRPFWRFNVDMDGHQFQRLLKSEAAGAEVYYVAPRFSDWRRFDLHYQDEAILEHSLLATPQELAAAAGGASGKHRVLYDRVRRHILSEPRPFREVRPAEFSERVAASARDPKIMLLDRMMALDLALRETLVPTALDREIDWHMSKGAPFERALALSVGLEAWVNGAQLLFVTDAGSAEPVVG